MVQAALGTVACIREGPLVVYVVADASPSGIMLRQTRRIAADAFKVESRIVSGENPAMMIAPADGSTDLRAG